MEEGKDPGEDGKEETKKRRKFEGAKEEKKPKKASKRDCKRKTSHEKELKDDEPQEAKNKKKQKVKRNGKKQKKRAPAPEAPAEPAEAEPSANVPQNPPRDDDVVQSDVLPNSKSLRLGVLLFSMKEMHKQGLEDDEAFERMKENLPDLKACRMNIYWSRAAVGLTCRAEKKISHTFARGARGAPMLSGW